jgi:hypothetical protein
MDFNSKVAFLEEIRENLGPYGYYFFSIAGEYLEHDTSSRDIVALEMDVLLDFDVYGDEGGVFNVERTIPFNTCKYFVKGQGKSFARSVKKEIANKMFDLGL